jgi:hypothetical protein
MNNPPVETGNESVDARESLALLFHGRRGGREQIPGWTS